MADSRFTFEGLDDITRRIHLVADRVAYLVVQDRTERGRDVGLGRFDLTVEEARQYLGDGDDAAEVTQAQLVDVGMRWVAELAASNTVGESWRRFRVKAWGPKGLRLVTSGQLVCRGSGPVLGHAAVPSEGVLQAVVAGMRGSDDPLD